MRNSINISKLTIRIILIGTLFGFQSTENDELKFSDRFGNNFNKNNSESIPNRLNSDFLKENLIGSYFVDSIAEPELRYQFNIIQIERINRDNYKLRTMITPQTDDISKILKYQGVFNYNLIIKTGKNGIEFQNIELLNGEI